jgi:hypothetical protein
MTGHWIDQYGNVVTDPIDDLVHTPGVFESFPGAHAILATFPGGAPVVNLRHDADGTYTLPPLTAGSLVPDTPGLPSGQMRVDAGFFKSAFLLNIAPGPPDAVTATAGDGQQTGPGRPFAQPLAARLTDAGGNPITHSPATFQVTSGATFPPLDLALLAAISGNPIAPGPSLPRDTVSVPTDADGIATAPVLTAGQESGQIVVTASAGGAAVTNAVFTLSVVGGAPTAPSPTNPPAGGGSGPPAGDGSGPPAGGGSGPPAGGGSGPPARPAPLPNLRVSASARWTRGSVRAPVSASPRRPRGLSG